MRLAALFTALVLTTAAHAQWEIQDAHITADLRGIDYVGNGVAWASGSNGTVLRTEDMGFVWQLCAMPSGAEKLDFRGVQAFDNNTAIVMSSGKGDLSRLYKTTDGCQTWKLLLTNPDADGFWDTLRFTSPEHGFLLGDPVLTLGERRAHFFLDETSDGGTSWRSWHNRPDALAVDGKQAIFAASNSSMIADQHSVIFATGGDMPSLFTVRRGKISPGICNCLPMPPKLDPAQLLDWVSSMGTPAPMAAGDSAGIFSLARTDGDRLMLVGGDYGRPNDSNRTAVLWDMARKEPDHPPHGYRSAVAYDPKSKTWITVGPNGTDISTDDGRNWRALKPDPKSNDTPDADQHWNALSLPFVVGPHGRIGILRDDALRGARQ